MDTRKYDMNKDKLDKLLFFGGGVSEKQLYHVSEYGTAPCRNQFGSTQQKCFIDTMKQNNYDQIYNNNNKRNSKVINSLYSMNHIQKTFKDNINIYEKTGVRPIQPFVHQYILQKQ